MRVSSFSNVPFIPPIAPQAVPPQTPCAPPAPAAFLPFSAQAFDQARLRDVRCCSSSATRRRRLRMRR